MTKPKIIQILEDIVYATLGGQNSDAHKRQFEQASLPTYILAGLLGIAVFVAVIALVVSLLI
ncbi:DUF2970 domain-containing protein [Crenothrix polyspora]|jgi:Protein of unknown function (DUF2970)|uniref:DUF2970 domain-containing protein n=1 Tax=Crenothrix polyspora TaxID=360316 RepID=A0A1R4GZR1_9GAMM|nr:DUF2970 domain-containing protein [Crenothrix polyspora]SJM89434.1 conserved hypothetical protein [Crenothrix polyspora]